MRMPCELLPMYLFIAWSGVYYLIPTPESESCGAGLIVCVSVWVFTSIGIYVCCHWIPE